MQCRVGRGLAGYQTTPTIIHGTMLVLRLGLVDGSAGRGGQFRLAPPKPGAENLGKAMGAMRETCQKQRSAWAIALVMIVTVGTHGCAETTPETPTASPRVVVDEISFSKADILEFQSRDDAVHPLVWRDAARCALYRISAVPVLVAFRVGR